MKAIAKKLLIFFMALVLLSSQAASVCLAAPVGGEKVGIRLDTGSLILNVGDYREIRVDFEEAPTSWELLKSNLLRCEKLEKSEGKTGYFRVTALATGKTKAGVKTPSGTVELPVTVKHSTLKLDTQEEIQLKTGESYGFTVTVESGRPKPLVQAQLCCGV